MGGGLLVIAFSFNRAMQLDCLLRSLLARLRVPDCEVIVVYHTTGAHGRAYEELEEAYRGRARFAARGTAGPFVADVLPLLARPRNLYRYAKCGYLRRGRDDFKRLTEGLIRRSACRFVMFATDDSYYYRDSFLPSDVRTRIAEDPFHVSYRLYVGANLEDAPSRLERQGDVLNWDYYDPAMTRHWAYPFAVDGTIYHAETLLKVMGPVLYHNPSTLEGFVWHRVRARHWFRRGLSPMEATMVVLPINKVQTVQPNFAGTIDVELLNQRFLEGYRMEYGLPEPVVQSAFIPERITLVRSGERVELLG